MKKILLISIAQLIFSFIVAIIFNEGIFDHDFMTGFGAINLVLAVLGILVGCFMLLARQKETGLSILAAAGIMLLIGAGVCTIYPLKLRMM